MADLKQAAKKIRKAGQKSEPGDSMLVHLEPEEAAMLLANGGSGEIDPETGLPHFNRETDRSNHDRDKSNDGNDGNDGDGGGGGGEGGGGSRGGNDVSGGVRGIGDAISRGVSDSIKNSVEKALGPRATDDGHKDPVAPTLNPASDVRPSQAAFGTLTPEQAANLATPGQPQTAYGIDAEKKFNWGAAVKTGVKTLLGTGNPALAVASGGVAGEVGAKVKSPSVNGGGWMENGGVTNSDGTSDAPESRAARDHNDPNGVAGSLYPSMTKPTPTPTQSTEDVDSFTRQARKKKGLGSTIVSGGAGGSAITMGKSLLGA